MAWGDSIDSLNSFFIGIFGRYRRHTPRVKTNESMISPMVLGSSMHLRFPVYDIIRDPRVPAMRYRQYIVATAVGPKILAAK